MLADLVCQRQPQPQPKTKPRAALSPPPLPPSQPRTAKKSAKAVKPEDVEEVEEADNDKLETLQADLRRLSSSLGAQRATRARAEWKVMVCEAKVEELRAGSEGNAHNLGVANVEKARQKVGDREDNVQNLERSVQRLED